MGAPPPPPVGGHNPSVFRDAYLDRAGTWHHFLLGGHFCRNPPSPVYPVSSPMRTFTWVPAPGNLLQEAIVCCRDLIPLLCSCGLSTSPGTWAQTCHLPHELGGVLQVDPQGPCHIYLSGQTELRPPPCTAGIREAVATEWAQLLPGRQASGLSGKSRLCPDWLWPPLQVCPRSGTHCYMAPPLVTQSTLGSPVPST